jgi:hypothetical protein
LSDAESVKMVEEFFEELSEKVKDYLQEEPAKEEPAKLAKTEWLKKAIAPVLQYEDNEKNIE